MKSIFASLLISAHFAFAGAASAQPYDFKGVVVGAPASEDMIRQKLGVPCVPQSDGTKVYNGTATLGGQTEQMNLIIGKTGNVQRISFVFLSIFSTR